MCACVCVCMCVCACVTRISFLLLSAVIFVIRTLHMNEHIVIVQEVTTSTINM